MRVSRSNGCQLDLFVTGSQLLKSESHLVPGSEDAELWSGLMRTRPHPFRATRCMHLTVFIFASGLFLVFGFLSTAQSSSQIEVPRPQHHSVEKNRVPWLTHSFFRAGLGNTLFFLASVLGLARANRRKPALPKRLPVLDDFSVSLPIVDGSALGTFKRIQDPGSGAYRPQYRSLDKLVGNHDAYFAGYMQSFKYFHSERDYVLENVAFKEVIISEARARIEAWKTLVPFNTDDWVGVHVRRGDFLQNSAKRGIHRTAPRDYFVHAMDHFRRLYTHPAFFVLSDDPNWCRHSLTRNDTVVVEPSTPVLDMASLSLMEDLILSVGTFGWWAGYLSRARNVLYYPHWFENGSSEARRFVREDFFPPSWRPTE